MAIREGHALNGSLSVPLAREGVGLLLRDHGDVSSLL